MTTLNGYEIIKEIGKGSFALVYLAASSEQKVAIKSISKDKLKGRLQDNVESEIKILKDFRHEHIVRLYDIVKTESHIHLVMEYCSMGDLSQFIKNKGSCMNVETGSFTNPGPGVGNANGGLGNATVFHFLRQLTSAMEFLRSKSLIHRDLKPQNILLSPDSYSSLPIIKLADFGFARLLPSQSLASTLCGSPLYMAPEILRGDAYDAKADLWSLGTIAYEMCYGKPPFRAQNHIELLRKIEKTSHLSFPDDPSSSRPRPFADKVDHKIKDFIAKLLKKNPIERITFEEFFFHPCVQGFPSAIQRHSPPPPNQDEPVHPVAQATPAPILPPPFPGYEVDTNVFSELLGNKIRTKPTTNIPSLSQSLMNNEIKSVESLRSNDDDKSDDFVVVEKGTVQVNWVDSENERSNHPSSKPTFHPPSSQPNFASSGHYEEPPYLYCPNQEKTLFLSQEALIPYLTKDDLKDEMNAFEDIDTLNLCALHAFAVHSLAHEYDQSSSKDVATQSEAVNLYLSSLALYQLAMDLSKSLWSKFGDQEQDVFIHISQLSRLVQFVQVSFQTCLERASLHTLANETSDICVRSSEKVIFMRAVELSNVGSHNESLGQDLPGCEMAYEQAIVLLEALLSIPSNLPSLLDNKKENSSASMQMTDEDRGLIETLVASLYSKAEQVRQKMKQSGII